MKRDYALHTLGDEEFEDLTTKLCIHWLGEGVIPFATGKDGGRDARFSGTANCFPSEAAPSTGRFVIQAKHTGAADASCSDPGFLTLVKHELPKITRLKTEKLLDHYLLFTNRKLTGKADKTLEKMMTAAGAMTAHVIARERIHAQLDLRQDIVRAIHALKLLQEPLLLEPSDLADVIHNFHAALTADSTPYDSAHNFTYLKKDSAKNKINGLSAAYYDYIEQKSMPYFPDIKKFLENTRNRALVDLYHDAADELKQQIIARRDEFDSFDEVFLRVYQFIVAANPSLKTKRRYVNTLLHYMYFDCDIGQHA